MISKTLDFPYQPELPYPFLFHTPNGPAIFIHIPKTGGTSINRALRLPLPKATKILAKHYTARVIKKHLPTDLWNEAYKFAFVRNPYERLYSHYRYRYTQNMILERFGQQFSFTDWVKKAITTTTIGNLRPQYQWVDNNQGALILDFLGRFEHISTDFQQICQHLGLSSITLPHLNKSTQQGEYLQHYDKESLAIATNFYQEDFRIFNYNIEL